MLAATKSVVKHIWLRRLQEHAGGDESVTEALQEHAVSDQIRSATHMSKVPLDRRAEVPEMPNAPLGQKYHGYEVLIDDEDPGAGGWALEEDLEM